tara:strand:+ start:123 stop:962 length:840 start_codon:yes stop_codon:yes gene_type:complete
MKGCTYLLEDLGHIVFGGIIASVVLMAALYGILKWRSEQFDKTAMISLSVGVLLLWFVPWGFFVIVPVTIIISFVSPASREEWSLFRNRRIAASLVLLVILNSFAFYPVSTPVGAEEWGDPIFTENPDASAWPASEQYTWIYDDAIISVLNTRTPHTFSPWSQDSSSVSLGVMLGMHDERLKQSIEAMNSYDVISIDSDKYSLEEIETEGSHQYGDETHFIARFDIKREGIDQSLATVLIVGFPNVGGELNLVSVTRAFASSQGDEFEERIVLQYIDSQ